MKKERPDIASFVLFLDRTHGRKTLPALLKRVGFVVEAHCDTFDSEEPDPIWIAECGRRDWIILSGDKRLETNVQNRQAVIEGRCKVFIFSDTNSVAEEWAASVIVGRDKISNLIRKYDGPFYVRISKLAQSHVSDPRFAQISERPKNEKIESSESSATSLTLASSEAKPDDTTMPSAPKDETDIGTGVGIRKEDNGALPKKPEPQ